VSSPFEHPERVGPYEIRAILGEGGMGVVYDAEQHEPVHRRVALKMMKVGMDTREVVARFEAERQALAAMEHPCVAKVFDAGASERGRPYFVMELVRGTPLTQYCDDHRLTVRERVALFADVCRGVQHAHQRGIIHRDLKPSNILITEVDDRPVPKVIDFGIAKATEESGDAGVTKMGQALGTPAYMSPEQADGGGADLDIRTDVYSLGILLYEVLAGALPFTDEELAKGGLQFLSILLTKSTPRPSARLPALADTQETIAALRRTRVDVLRRTLDGELDWVVMKAIEKDRDRRYSSVGDLLRELEAFLNDQPVEARPPSFGYRAGKFIRRNRAAAGAALVALVAVLGGTVAATVGFLRARAAEAEARLEAQASAEVTDFVTGLFEVSNPSEARGNTVTARELLAAGAERIERELAGQPALQARMMYTIGDVYRSLWLMEEAQALLAQAVTIREREFGPSSVEVADALVALGEAKNSRETYAGNDDIDRALRIYEERLGPDALEVADALASFSLFYGDSLRLAYDSRSLEIRTLHLPEGDPKLANAYTALGATLAFLGRPDTAEVLYRKALDIFQDGDLPGQIDVLSNLAITATEAGRFAEAGVLYDQATTVADRFFGEASAQSANVLANRALMEFQEGDLTLAVATQREAIRRLVAGLGPDANNLDWHYFQLGSLLRRQQAWSQLAENASQLAQYSERADYPPESVAGARFDQATALLKDGRPSESLALLEQALPVLLSRGAPYYAPTALYAAALASEALGEVSSADAYFHQAITSLEESEEEFLMSIQQGLVAVPADEVLTEAREDYAAFRARR
jgi:non-specific serine/threonine protein kinase/serine/threonine-protein kinase